MKRRIVLGWLAALRTASAQNTAPSTAPNPRLDSTQSRIVRDWISVLVHAQLEQGPSPRWTHRDCAGLVRFAVAESLREHDVAWRKSMGLLSRPLPPEPDAAQAKALRQRWQRADGTRGAFVSALELVQANTRFVSRTFHQAQVADLLFFDLGDEQHLMLWLGPYVAYHNGSSDHSDHGNHGNHGNHGDNGLRAVRVAQLRQWSDTRWRPEDSNPNFVGLFRLAFMA
ncbi:MAG: DUF1175 family protein [Leptothrix ochracea]|uniref:DUF1175 family protein n=1 Tax=Leptothrix ochracea TaxID=735331 RepID=UPI0034E2A9AA